MAEEPLIAIIDDDESLRPALVSLLRSFAYGVRDFASAEAFLRFGGVEDYACIITDIQMPGLSGIDLKRHLAECQINVPVIMITARTEAQLEHRVLACGAVCFLRKPFEATALVDCLKIALGC